MNLTASRQLNDLRRELGLTGRKILLATLLGVIIGVALALLRPLPVS